MEIKLLGYPAYKIEGWQGTTEVQALSITQLKRLSGSTTLSSLLRKMVKICKTPDSPIKLPDALSIEELNFKDFMQALIGVVAVSRGRQFKRVYKCQKCSAQNPRVLDIISVFQPIPAKDPSGTASLDLTVNDVTKKVELSYLRVKDFLDVCATVENLELLVVRNDKGAIVNASKLNDRYGFLMTVEDDEDLTDLADIVQDIGVVAYKLSAPGLDTLEQKLDWLCKVRSDRIDVFQKISETLLALSPAMANEYKTQCSHCKSDITDKLEATDYFFAIRLETL